MEWSRETVAFRIRGSVGYAAPGARPWCPRVRHALARRRARRVRGLWPFGRRRASGTSQPASDRPHERDVRLVWRARRPAASDARGVGVLRRRHGAPARGRDLGRHRDTVRARRDEGLDRMVERLRRRAA